MILQEKAMEKPTPPQELNAEQGIATASRPPPPIYEPEDPNSLHSVFTNDTRDFPLPSPSVVHTSSFQPSLASQMGPSLNSQMGYPPQEPGVPLGLLQSQSAPVICSKCGTRAMTITTPEAGVFTHGVAALVCLVSGLGCIPYCINSLKDVHHRCGRCGVPLATFRRSGRTEIVRDTK